LPSDCLVDEQPAAVAASRKCETERDQPEAKGALGKRRAEDGRELNDRSHGSNEGESSPHPRQERTFVGQSESVVRLPGRTNVRHTLPKSSCDR
jgi:hypothetical protein